MTGRRRSATTGDPSVDLDEPEASLRGADGTQVSVRCAAVTGGACVTTPAASGCVVGDVRPWYPCNAGLIIGIAISAAVAYAGALAMLAYGRAERGGG